MKCPLCKGKTTVLESRSSGKTKYRRRRCKECGQVFHTEELLSDGIDQSRLQAEAMNRQYWERKRENQKMLERQKASGKAAAVLRPAQRQQH